MTATDFDALLARVKRRLVELGCAILAGEAAVDPYQKGASQRACGACDYQAICRIDPWTHPYRRLTGAGD
jgi:ATP-dependent helicase/DNAse subunit B